MTRSKATDTETHHGYRSGQAARLVGMPVTTLRIWERRYGIVAPPTTASGQRLYSEQDVQRLTLLKSLVDSGYAIGSIARFDDAQLASLDRGHPAPQHHAAPTHTKQARQDLHLAIVGEALAERIRDDGSELKLRGLQIGATIAGLQELETLGQRAGDILIIEISGLQDDTAEKIVQAIRGAAYRAVAVVYAFGANSAADSLQLAGVRLYRRPANRSEMRQMLRDLARDAIDDLPLAPGGGRRQRRFDERELKAMTGLAQAVTCECPRHIVELILQLDAFETYSDNCSIATPADRMLHRLLGDISNQARHAFETALERVAAGHLDSRPS
ncbi:MerR family transcriptional regulator [Bordetella sp. FB-8]|uniref:MerR family transcriptional regulator n=1 Tax=Bordetella sp. FB-8 TaxID=1159870 RepID=UPI000369F40E|nr:MerR family transcriptional regulator [Bordetella sp. FB-8]